MQFEHGFLKAGLGVLQRAGHAGGIGHRRLANIIVEVQHRDVRGLDLAVRRNRQRIIAAERDKVGTADADRGRIRQRVAGDDESHGLFHRIAELIGHGHRHGVLAVLQRQADGRSRVGIIRLDLIAVDFNRRCRRIDAGAVLTVHIVIRSDRFDRVGIDNGGAVARERLAVDRHAADDRIIQVIEVCAVDHAVIIEVQRAVFAVLELGVAAGLIG